MIVIISIMITNTIDPILFKLGALEIRYYGIIYALGFVIAYLFMAHYIKKGKVKNMNTKKLDDLILYLLIGVVVGSRLFYTIFYPPYLLFTAPLSALKVWEGGLAFHGGLIGVVLVIYLFSKKHKVKKMEILDALVIPTSLALAFGRIANFTNHELYGYVTNVPWCVNFKGVIGCRHPYQIYAFITHILLFGILILIYKNQKRIGTTFWNFVLFYGVFRFITDFFKVEQKFIGLGIGQIMSLVMIGLSIYLLNRSRHAEPK